MKSVFFVILCIISFCVSKFLVSSAALEKHKRKVGCGGTYTLTDGNPSITITYPHPWGRGHYRGDLWCKWDIELYNPLGKINFTLQNLDTEYEENCGYDYLQILPITEGETFCGKKNHQITHPLPFNKVYESPMKWVFKSDSGGHGYGFQVIISIVTSGACEGRSNPCTDREVCRDTHNAYQCYCKEGYIRENGSCEDINECLINNGGCDQICTNLVGSFECNCTQDFKISSDEKTCIDQRCNYNVNGTSGIIVTPNYPRNYPEDMDCTRKLITTQGHRIQLVTKIGNVHAFLIHCMKICILQNFKRFEMEQDNDCKYDRLQLYDGGTTSTQQLDILCGHLDSDTSVTSYGNKLLMLLRSDSSDSYGGFLAQFKAVCGGTLYPKRTMQKIYSHANYDTENYGPNTNCTWRIRLKEGIKIKLNFTVFSLETKIHDGECSDYVEILNKSGTTGRLCGFQELPIIGEYEWSRGDPSVTINFVTDNMVERKGFILQYIKSEKEESGEEEK